MLDIIDKTFNLQPSIPVDAFAARLEQLCRALIQINAHSAEQNALYQRIVDYVKDRSSRTTSLFRRSELRSELKEFPFSCTLMLIPEARFTDEEYRQFTLQCALLAQLYIARGADDYDAFLAFYKALLKPAHSVNLPFSADFVCRATIEELQLTLKKVSKIRRNVAIHELASFYQKKRLPALNVPNQNFLTAKNIHQSSVPTAGGVHLTYIDATDSHGHRVGSALGITPDMTHTQGQDRKRFNIRRSGMQNALYNAEVAAPWSLGAATPQELQSLLLHIHPRLLSANFNAITPYDSKMLLYFFARLLGLPEPWSLTLINHGSSKFEHHAPEANSISYAFVKRRSGELHDAKITLSARLIDTNPPSETARRLHHASREVLTMRLPEPLLPLLQTALYSIDASRRLHHSIEHAFRVTRNEYVAWLNTKIKDAGFKVLGLTKSSFEKAFLHYAREITPETTLAVLTGQSSVQCHYVSVRRSDMITAIESSWRAFCQAAGLSHVSSIALPSYPRDHDEVGSKLTLRMDALDTLLTHLLTSNENIEGYSALDMSIQGLNQLALYSYLRIASTVGLRPVSKPFPSHEFYSATQGVMSVADKRAHHKEERRLIVLTQAHINLITSYQIAANALSQRLSIPPPSALIMHFDVEHQMWRDFSPTLANRLLSELTQSEISNHTLRHVAATRFVTHHTAKKTFSQPALDQLMNHSRAGVLALNPRQIGSMQDIIVEQRTRIFAYDQNFETNDKTAARQLINIKEALAKC